ncbi:MAG: hypothetical protein ACFFB8_05200 [Promethearchaeota archaeon]
MLHLGKIQNYLDHILLETLNRLDASKTQKRMKSIDFGSLKRISLMPWKEGVQKILQDFWKVYDELNFEWRKKLIEKG